MPLQVEITKSASIPPPPIFTGSEIKNRPGVYMRHNSDPLHDTVRLIVMPKPSGLWFFVDTKLPGSSTLSVAASFWFDETHRRYLETNETFTFKISN